MRKAKIVDTIGPSTESPEGITKLVEAGMDVARLNRSHGTPEDHLKVYNNVRAASKATGRNVAAMVDLQGPKIRCGWFKKNAEGEDKVQLEEGQEFIITTDDVEGDEHITSTTFKGLPGDCHPGDPILIDDGKVRLEVTKVEGNNVHTKAVELLILTIPMLPSFTPLSSRALIISSPAVLPAALLSVENVASASTFAGEST